MSKYSKSTYTPRNHASNNNNDAMLYYLHNETQFDTITNMDTRVKQLYNQSNTFHNIVD